MGVCYNGLCQPWPEEDAMIRMENLTKCFDDLTAVAHLSLEVGEGEVLALLGPNGAGKTTTVRMLSAVLRPTEGRAEVAGFDTVRQAREVRRNVGVLTEAPGLYLRMSGREYLTFFGRVRGLEGQALRRRIGRLAEQFQMAEALDRRLGTYSKGMRQKIALIRTLLHEPPVLLLDEPTSAMDPGSAHLVRQAIQQMRDGKRAVILCTHNLMEAEMLADRIAVISQGRILVEGTPDDLKEQLLGPPPLELTVEEAVNAELLTLILPFGRIQSYDERRVLFQLREGKRSADLLRKLLNEGWSVRTLAEKPRSLEALYLRVVAGEQELKGVRG